MGVVVEGLGVEWIGRESALSVLDRVSQTTEKLYL